MLGTSPIVSWVQNDHVLGLVGQLTDLLATFVIQRQVPGAADDIENVSAGSLVNGDRAVSIDVPAHEIDAGPGQSGSLGIVEPLVGSAPAGTSSPDGHCQKNFRDRPRHRQPSPGPTEGR